MVGTCHGTVLMAKKVHTNSFVPTADSWGGGRECIFASGSLFLKLGCIELKLKQKKTRSLDFLTNEIHLMK